MRRAAREQNPRNAVFAADLTNGVELPLGSLCRNIAVADGQIVRCKRALELEKIDGILGFGEFAHALDHQHGQLAG
jgi:hypothetical protein